jgi:hypothetical protein
VRPRVGSSPAARRRSAAGRAGRFAGVAVVALVAGCTEEQVQLPPEPTPTAVIAPPATETAAAFPQTCSELVDPARFTQIVAAPVGGETTRVYAGPLPSAGRTQRLTCAYGVPGGSEAGEPGAAATPAPAAVSLTLNEYVDADTAAGRLDVTAEAAQSAGEQVVAAPLDEYPGYLLRGDAAVSAVVAADTRTAVATLRRGLVPEAAEPVVLEGLLAAMLGLPGPSPVPGPTPEDDVTDPWATGQPQP